VQSDNTIRECKNRIFLGYLTWLVHMGVFDKVRVHAMLNAAGYRFH
jgi:hypothetical protein